MTNKMMIRISLMLSLALSILITASAAPIARMQTAKSPDGEIELALGIRDGKPVYSVKYRDSVVVNGSNLGLKMKPEAAGWSQVEFDRGESDREWEPVFGKRSPVRNRYNWLSLAQPVQDDKATLEIVFRVYNDGIAYRYRLRSPTGSVDILADLSEFRLSGNPRGWHYNGEHRPQGPINLKDFAGKAQLPLLVEAGDDLWLAVAEAALYDFPPFTPRLTEGSGTLAVNIDGTEVDTPFATPWRVLMIAEHPGTLVDSDIMMNLNPPNKKADFEWLQPGVAFWDWRAMGYKADDGFVYGQNFETWKRFIDLAAESGVRYLQIDANWYGPEFAAKSDPFTGGKSEQVKEAIEYGKRKGVGLILYLNHVAASKFGVEDILAAYSDWGAAGIKYGFMKGQNDRDKVNRTRYIIEKCAENRLSVNFHDGPIPPSGDERTWPNCLTREYCHSQSDAKRTHGPGTFVLQAYVNTLMGPVDMCNGMFDLDHSTKDRPKMFKELYSTIVAEAARTLLIYSGLTVVPDSADSYRKHRDLFEFIAAQKQPWKESRTLSGEMGEYICMMRRTGETYLVAAATDDQARTIEIPLDFLPAGEFEAVIFKDGPNAHYKDNREEYETERRKVDAADVIKARMAPGGGYCMIIKEPSARPSLRENLRPEK